MACNCSGADYSLSNQMRLGQICADELGIEYAVYEFERGKYRTMPVSSVAKGIKIEIILKPKAKDEMVEKVEVSIQIEPDKEPESEQTEFKRKRKKVFSQD